MVSAMAIKKPVQFFLRIGNHSPRCLCRLLDQRTDHRRDGVAVAVVAPVVTSLMLGCILSMGSEVQDSVEHNWRWVAWVGDARLQRRRRAAAAQRARSGERLLGLPMPPLPSIRRRLSFDGDNPTAAARISPPYHDGALRFVPGYPGARGLRG